MFAYPSSTSAYRLTAGDSFYSTRRNGPVLGIVLHVTAGLQDTDMVGPDHSAEGTASWALSSKAEVSWHAGVDSDSIVPCLPDTYTAWHAKGYNSRTWGVEISNRDAVWGNKPKDWTEATLRNAAKACAPIVKKYGLPLQRVTRSTVDARIAAGKPFGFTYHSYLSDIRVDPGKDFPWDRFIALVKAELNPPAPKPQPATTTEVPTMFLVQLAGSDPVYKSDGFRRIHVTKVQRDALLSAGVKLTVVKTAQALDAFGKEVSA